MFTYGDSYVGEQTNGTCDDAVHFCITILQKKQLIHQVK